MRLFCVMALVLSLAGFAQAQQVTVTAPPPTNEGDAGTTNFPFQVTLDNSPTSPLTLTVQTVPGTATSPEDFPAVNRTITFQPGQTLQIVNVTVNGDNNFEANETFSLNVSNARFGTNPAPPGSVTFPNGANSASAIATILNDDNVPTVSISAGPATREDAPNAKVNFNVRVSPASGRPIVLTFNTQNGSATATEDYSPLVNFKVTLAAGQTSYSQAVDVLNDNVYEGDEGFSLVVTANPQEAVVAGNGAATGIIIDDDIPTFRVDNASASEGTPENFRFTLIGNNGAPVAALSPVTFTYQLQDVTANLGSDYTYPGGNNPGSADFTIPIGQSSGVLAIPTIGDTVDEPTETFRLAITNIANARASTNNTATGTIIDTGTVSFSASAVSVSEAVPNRAVTLTARLSKANTQAVTVQFATSDGTATSTSIRDFTARTGTLTIPAGQLSAGVTIEIIDDNIFEGDENFTVTLSNPTNATLGVNKVATVTIVDNEQIPQVRLSPTAVNLSEAVGASSVKVILLSRSQTPITVNYAFVDGTGPTDAKNGQDYTGTNGSVTFQPLGSLVQEIPFTIIDDTLFESRTEPFTILLTQGAGTFTFFDNPPQTTVNILDNERAPAIRTLDVTVNEGNPNADPTKTVPTKFVFDVNLSAPSGQDVTFNYSVVSAKQPDCLEENGCSTAQSDDYRVLGSSGVIPAGETSTQITVNVDPDTLNEFDEQFAVVLTNNTGAGFEIFPGDNGLRRTGNVAYGTIINDDAVGTVKFEGPKDPLIENFRIGANTEIGGRAGTFTITLSKASGRTQTFVYSVTGSANPQAGFDDVDNPTGEVVIRAGATVGTFTLRAAADNISEATENLTISLRPRDGGLFTIDTANSTAKTTIINNTARFAAFSPLNGNDQFSDADPTTVTITGDNFRSVTNNTPLVRAVIFNGSTPVRVTGLDIADDGNSLKVSVPFGARTGPISVELLDGTILFPSDRGANRSFFVQPVVTDFSPRRGVPRFTRVIIKGRRFQDVNAPVTAVKFNGVASNANSAGESYQIVNDTTILATVPDSATNGPISVSTIRGDGPNSAISFTVDSFQTGGIKFQDNPDIEPIFENASGTALAPVRQFDLFLRPATQNNGANTPLRPRNTVTVTVSIVDNTTTGANPLINVRGDLIGNGTFNLNASGANVKIPFPANYDISRPVRVSITYAGDDFLAPVFDPNIFQQSADTTNVAVSATVTASLDTGFYPVGQAAGTLTLKRFDLHGLETDIGAVLRTNEDPNSPANKTSFPLNLRNTNFFGPTGNLQPATINPDGSFNDDAVPTSDVFLPLVVNKPDEALITYFVMVDGQKIFPGGAVPRANISVIYAVDPTRPEFYGNPHFIEATGQDDSLQDGPQTYQIILDTLNTNNPNENSTDPEYKFRLVAPFVLINDDNEQSTNTNGKGYDFTKISGTPPLPRLQVDENGSQDTLTVRLRAQPSSDVTLVLRSNAPDVVRIVDPSQAGNVLTDELRLTFRANADGDGRTTARFDRALAVTVQGINDGIRNAGGSRQGTIVTTVITQDPTYASIDPADIIVTNTDIQTSNVSVTPTNLVVDENSNTTFTVQLNSRPTGDVVITLSSSDPRTAIVTGSNRLTFTSANFNTPQTVTVTGVPDNNFTVDRVATIVTSNATSSDPNFNNLAVPDVTVNVQNTETAFNVTPLTGLTTSEDGRTSTFTVQLRSAPTGDVNISLAVDNTREALLSTPTNTRPAGAAVLTFNASNFNVAQTITVTGQDDNLVDGDQPFAVTGTVSTNDLNFAQQGFPAVRGTNADNDGTNSVGSLVFPANTTNGFSVPFSTNSNGTISQAQAFDTAPVVGGVRRYAIYRFNAAGQTNQRTNSADFVQIGDTELLQRGVGYRILTFSTDVSLRTRPTGVQFVTASTFSINLTRNRNFAAQSNNQPNSLNGYNYIGFPFDPTQFRSVDFSQSQVISDGATRSLSEAVAAGLINPNLFTVDDNGNLTPVSSSNQILQPFRAYFVQIYRDNLTLVLRNPVR